MTGLEKIIEKIAEDSAEECKNIISQAKEQADQMIADARNEARKKANKITDEAKAQADKKLAVSKSGAESITRNRYLSVKNAVVNDIISAAYEEIEKMSDEDYFDLLYKLCIKNVETGECVMRLNAKDLRRLPAGFEDRINGAVFEKAAVQVSKKPYDIENGFVLIYDDFEINCTLRTVFDSEMDKLKDILSRKLFS
ncbi:MAG: V-type ATP synthase subunit E [Acutalibacteraceae bacterium]